MVYCTLHANSLVGKIAWLLWSRKKGSAVAITFGHHIFFSSDKLSELVMRHECCHVTQYARLGFFGFLVRYLWYTIRYGYTNNPLEVEARYAETIAK
jgi:hypothetical protein